MRRACEGLPKRLVDPEWHQPTWPAKPPAARLRAEAHTALHLVAGMLAAREYRRRSYPEASRDARRCSNPALSPNAASAYDTFGDQRLESARTAACNVVKYWRARVRPTAPMTS